MQIFKSAVTVLMVMFVAACGGTAANTPTTSNAAQTSSSTTSGTTNAGSAVSIHVQLAGGPTPGAWDVAADQPCQVTHTAQTGTIWTVLFNSSDPQNKTKLGTFSLGYSADGPAANTFTVQAQVGDISSATGYLYVVATGAVGQSVGGSGTVSVQDGGATAKISVDAQTKEGYSIKATVQCNHVQRTSA